MTESPGLELADIVKQHGDAFLARHGARLTQVQRKALRDVAACRTAALGGHRWQCATCGHAQAVYHSCRNRHCPKCQGANRARWLERQQQCLLPVEYFHVVFTLPAEVAEVALVNPVTIYNLLFRAARATLVQVAANPKFLGAALGVLLVLHTWGQNLHHHPHVHGVVSGGGLSCDEAGKVDTSPRWVSCRRGFFLPVRVLSRVYRGKFLALLRQAFAAGQLRWNAWSDQAAFEAWARPLYQRDWVVYAKKPFGGPQQVLKYLARYTHRVALSNSRLVDLSEGVVRFGYKDYRHQQRRRVLALPAEEFLRRWVQHVLPRGFVKVRHYGLWCNRGREQTLRLCRRLLFAAGVVVSAVPESAVATAAHEPVCPWCGGVRWLWGEELPPEDVGVTLSCRDTS
jgi:hypothetical protein